MRRSVMKKFLFVLMLAAFMSCMAFSCWANANNYSVFKEAVLFRIDGDILRFNSMRTADISFAEINDETGSGINSLAALRAFLGTPDLPPFRLGTEVMSRDLNPRALTATIEVGSNNKVRKLTVTGNRKRPIVAISWSSNSSNNTAAAQGFERLGAYAVWIPQARTQEEANEYISKVNGFASTGGGDFHPYFMGVGSTPHGTTSWGVDRDLSDVYYVRAACWHKDVPYIGFCRGEQVLNLALNGGLIQDVMHYNKTKVREGKISESRITGYSATTTTHTIFKYEDTFVTSADGTVTLLRHQDIPSTIVSCDETCSPGVYIDGVVHGSHRQSSPSLYTDFHRVAPSASSDVGGILPNTKWIYNIVGVNALEYGRTAHHQAVDPDKLGDGITIAAYSSDGIVEAIERKENLFCIGTQWHPESHVVTTTTAVSLDYDQSVAFLREMVKYAGIDMDRKALFGMFKDNKLPSVLKFEVFDFESKNDNRNLQYSEFIKDEGTLLSNSMLDGWSIVGVNPGITLKWKAEVVGGAVVVTLKKDVDNEAVTVMLSKGGQTKDVMISFSGEKTPSEDEKGCNAIGIAVLALFLIPIYMWKRR